MGVQPLGIESPGWCVQRRPVKRGGGSHGSGGGVCFSGASSQDERPPQGSPGKIWIGGGGEATQRQLPEQRAGTCQPGARTGVTCAASMSGLMRTGNARSENPAQVTGHEVHPRRVLCPRSLRSARSSPLTPRWSTPGPRSRSPPPAWPPSPPVLTPSRPPPRRPSRSAAATRCATWQWRLPPAWTAVPSSPWPRRVLALCSSLVLRSLGSRSRWTRCLRFLPSRRTLSRCFPTPLLDLARGGIPRETVFIPAPRSRRRVGTSASCARLRQPSHV